MKRAFKNVLIAIGSVERPDMIKVATKKKMMADERAAEKRRKDELAKLKLQGKLKKQPKLSKEMTHRKKVW